MCSRLVAALIGIAIVLGAAPVSADETRVLVVTSDAALMSALEAALGPWGVELVALPAPSPGTSMPGSADRGAELAEAHDADAVVWVSESEDGFALWTYDTAHERVSARRLSTGPPFPEATAASVALSVKTLLRNTRIAPAAESTLGVGPPEQTADEPNPAPQTEPAGRPSSAAVSDTPPPEPSSASLLWIEPVAGTRLGHDGSPSPELRFGLGFGLWPGSGRVGYSLYVTSGPGFEIDHPSFAGRFLDIVVALGVAARLPVGDWGVGGSARIGLQVTTLDGAILPGGLAVHELRANPQAAIYARVDRSLSERLRIVLRAGASLLMRHQTYLVRGQQVFALHFAGVEVLLGLEVGLD